jgi:D-alanyl-D-alanine carboxypeptidase
MPTSRNQPRIGHTGGTYGFTAANFYFPEQKLRIIALTNNADNPEPGEILANVVFDDLNPGLARASARPAADEDRAVTARAKAGFESLQHGTGGGSVFGASLEAKLKAGLATRMAGQFSPYGAPTAYIFKGRRSDNGKSWSDYLIEFGPGSALKFSIALDGDGRILSIGFNNF